jgi:homogentisate 1,2-dioxygenase
MDQHLYSRSSNHSPFNVAAWHGNYLPYKYNLQRFCAMNSVTYDHPDPSIYTVLTYPSHHYGTALADFVIFPPRYMAVDSNTFRPPWFHRNCMSEYMGLIYGAYDAKSGKGFVPGGASLHNCMVPHGPDTGAYGTAVADPCESPVYFDKGLAFMFESCMLMRTSPQAETLRDVDYKECWSGLDVQCDWDELQMKRKMT